MIKKILPVLVILGVAIYFLFFRDPVVLAFRVGVTAGPHMQIMAKVKTLAAKEGLLIQIVEFNDFILPNLALAQGELDANSYQHKPFLEEQIKNRDLKLVPIAETVLMPLRVYSLKIKNFKELRDKAVVAIPNDPTNGGRALLLLKRAGLIDLKAVGNPTVRDIIANPKQLKVFEVEAPQLPRALQDADICVINTDWVLLAGLDPASALIQEDEKNPYANVIAVREGDEERPDVKTFVKIYQSEPVKDYIRKTFKGAVMPVWAADRNCAIK